MIGIPASVKILYFTAPVDMRKGPDGLCAVIQKSGEDVFSGQLFVFVSRRRNRAKILWWDEGGFVVWYKRLEMSCFKPCGHAHEDRISLTPTRLAMLLDGIDIRKVRMTKKWRPKNQKS